MAELPAEADPDKMTEDALNSRNLPPGGAHYRAYVGPPNQYDAMGATQFSLLTSLGLQEEHRLLDVGCGSLRAGRLFITYLLPGCYFGIEPNEHLWRIAAERELGNDALAIKRPQFSPREDFRFDDSGRRYDFILAQSIFSHAGMDLLKSGLAVLASQLEENGQLLFTVIDEESGSYPACTTGKSTSGWLYPACVRYERSDLLAFCKDADLFVQKIDWRHPRQTWYRAVLSEAMLIGENCIPFVNGRVLFNPRFR